ncbi:MAG: hypothetical protein GVY36_04625 [Verrucomicrobia bacterium]|nr:hypothetical protein [Verrucomicrobiota bacterium]
MDNHFQPTLDLPGVLGIFCLNASGQLLANYLPSGYRDSIFDELGARCTTLLEAVDMSYTPTDEYLIRFEEHSLYLRKTESCIIGVLCAGDVMLAGLRVSVNLLLKGANEAILALPVIETTAVDRNANLPNETVEEVADDVIISTKKNEDEAADSKAPKKRRGLFGFGGKKKDTSPNDIWG